MFSCCRCVNPKSPKQKHTKDGAHKGEEQTAATVGQSEPSPGREENLSTDEEIKIEIIEKADNPPEQKSAAANANGTTGGEEGVTVAVVAPEARSPPSETAAATGSSTATASGGPVVTSDEETGSVGEARAATVSSTPASSSPVSKTLSSERNGQSSSAVTEIEAKVPSADGDSTDNASESSRKIPTTIADEVESRDANESESEQVRAESEPSPQPEPQNEVTPVDTKVSPPLSVGSTDDASVRDGDYAEEPEAASPQASGVDAENVTATDAKDEDNDVAVDQDVEPPERDPTTTVDVSEQPESENPLNATVAIAKETVDEILAQTEAALAEVAAAVDEVAAAIVKTEREEREMGDKMEAETEVALEEEMVTVPQEPDGHVVEDVGDVPESVSPPDLTALSVCDTSNSPTRLEETIAMQPKYLSPAQSESRSDEENLPSSPSSDNEHSPNGNGSEQCNDTNVPVAVAAATAEAVEAAAAATPSPPEDAGNQQVSKSSSERDCGDDLSESTGQNGTDSRKESVNSDDTTIRTQLSFKESCLSRRSSSKSSIKKKVAYNESTEIIPAPEYPPMLDDDEVFSDSIAPKLPRGDMCTPYATKRGSLPGLFALPDWFAEDRLMMEEGGIMEPPTTPIGRDELALRRHRFFSELLNAAHAAVEHRVRFDPLGPEVAKDQVADCDPDLKPSSARELECLIDRLERIVDRLERTVSARELEETRRILKDACVIGKTVVRSTAASDAHVKAVTERENYYSRIVDSAAGSELPTVLPSTPPPSASFLHQQIDSLETTLFPELNSREPANGFYFNEPTQYCDSNQHRQPPPPPTVIPNVTDFNRSKYTNLFTDQEQSTVLSSGTAAAPSHHSANMSINAYEDILLGTFANFLSLSAKIGGDVATQAQFVKEAFDVQFAFLKVAAASSAPSNTDLQNLLKPTSDKISTIQSFREKHRTSPFFNHLSAISESIPALGWVCVSPTPGPYVKEMNDAGQFYTNRVLKDWKEKDATHVEWARAWVQTLSELQQYIKQHHTTGLIWAGKDKPVTGGAGVPPPPPPCGLPPPPPMMPLDDLSGDGGGKDRSALFAQINQGADITKGLKKVTADMQTHKNPALRSGPAPYKAPTSISNGTQSVAAPAVSKPPSFTRDGKKWLIEYQKNNPELVVEDAEMNNVVYMFRCENSNLKIKGKINSVVMDSCKKCSLVFESLVASAEFVNCQSVQMQVLGKVPTISIDKTDGCQMYLSSDSLGVEIISSKSSEMNVMIPKDSSGDYTEQPIPEQFKTTVKGKVLSTACVESLG